MSGGKSGASAAARILVAGPAVVGLCLATGWLVGVGGGPGATSGVGGGAEVAGTAAPSSAPTPVPDGGRHGGRSSSVERAAPAPVRPGRSAAREDRAVARSAVRGYVGKATKLLAVPRMTHGPAVARIATPAFAGELRAAAASNRANGVRVVGEPTVSDLKVLELDTSGRPATAVVEACVDSSAVQLVDARGRTVRQPAQPPTWQLFSLVRTDGRWLIDGQGFPDDPACRQAQRRQGAVR